MSVNTSAFMNKYNNQDIWAESILNMEYINEVDKIHKDLYMKISSQAEEIKELIKIREQFTEQEKELSSVKEEVIILKKQIESLFNKGVILRNKNTKTIMRVETFPACNHWDIISNRLGTSIALEYDPPSRPTEKGGKPTENTIWTFESV